MGARKFLDSCWELVDVLVAAEDSVLQGQIPEVSSECPELCMLEGGSQREQFEQVFIRLRFACWPRVSAHVDI